MPPLFLAWVALSVAAAYQGGSYWAGGVALLCLAVFWLYRPARRDEVSPLPLALAGASLSWLGRFHTEIGPFESVITSAQAVSLLLLLTYLPSLQAVAERFGAVRRLRFPLLLGLVGVQGLAAIVGIADPQIDVFTFLTEGARGLLHGQDPYAMQFTPLPPSLSVGYQDPAYHFDVYAYLPAMLLITLPGVLVGDVRLGMLAAALLAALLLRQIALRLGRSVDHAELGAATFLAYPGLLHVLQRSWVEPLIVAIWLLGLSAQTGGAGSRRLAPVLGGVVLALKQFTAPLLLPMATLGLRPKGFLQSLLVAGGFVLPFFLWNPPAFLWDAVQYQLQAPSRADALSLNGFVLNTLDVDLPGVIGAGIPALASMWALLGVLRGASFAETTRRVAGAYLLTFLFGKLAFANYYFLTQAVLLLAAVAPRAPVVEEEETASPPPISLRQLVTGGRHARVLVFIVAYNASRTIDWVLSRIPAELAAHETEVLIIDDASHDETFEVAERVRRSGRYPFKLTVLANPVNQGYGGNQKLGFLYAVEHGFDVVALVHGDGQYAPEALPTLLAPILEGEADAVLGSRMMSWTGALRGGMPLYKYVGNRMLTAVQNALLGSNLSEFHTGYRLYAVDLLKRLPFPLNSNAFHFDTEIIIQLLLAGARIQELPIPTYYGNEKCHVNGLKYALDVVRASVAARLQAVNLVYRRNFDVQSTTQGNQHYVSKTSFTSTHTYALSEVRPGETVVDIGCAGGYVAEALNARGCRVMGIDLYQPEDPSSLAAFFQRDLDRDPLPDCVSNADVVLLLDVVEHLRSPEAFMDQLHAHLRASATSRIVISTGNVGFWVTRLMLLFGHFNYGKRGILDLTHTRLFTFAALRRLLQESGFEIEVVRGVPAPIPEVVRNPSLANVLLRINDWAIQNISRGLFAYQMFVVARPLPTLASLLEASQTHTQQRAAAASA